MFRFSLLGAVAAFSDETSLMQGLKPAQDVKKNHKGAVANLLESAKGLLKNGETADVVQFASATLDEIRSTVIPAIQDAHNVEQGLLRAHFAAFEEALVRLTQEVSEVHQLDQEEYEHHQQHFDSRVQEDVICGHKRECDYELYALWRTFIDEESDVRNIENQIYHRSSGHFCAEDAHGNYIMNGTTHEFRVESVPIMNEFTRQWPIVVQAEANYDLKVPVCEALFENLDRQTGIAESHQNLEESTACQHRLKVQQVRHDFDCAWSAAMYTYDLTEKESRLMMLDRIREYQTLTTVECLLDRTTERNGRPCDEHTDEVNTEITHCEEMRRGVDITFLELEYECEVRECGNLPNGIGPHLAEDGSTLPGCDGPLVCPALPPRCEYAGDVVIASRCYPDEPVHPCTAGQIFAGLPAVPQPDFHSSNSHCNQRTPCQACDLPDMPSCPVPEWVWAEYTRQSIRYGSAEYHALANTQPAPVTQAPSSPAVCPVGWLQVGEAGGDIGGCGLQSCSERYTTTSEAECAASCDTMEECDGFSYAPLRGDRNHEDTTVCTLYNSNVPTGTWTGSAGTVQVFCGREDGGSASQCAPDALEKCQGNTPCIDLREGVNHHHLMWLNSDGTAHVDGEANGIGAGDSRTWTCTSDGNTVGLVGTWNCPGFYSTVVTITADFADDFTPARDNDFIHVCALPEQEHTGYGQPCTEGTATIDGVPVCTVASQDGSSSPWVLMGDIDHQISNFVSSQVTSSATSSGLHNADSVQVGTFSTGTIGSSGYSLDIGQFCAGGSCGANFDLMIQYGDSDVFSHSETGYSTTSGGFINNGHTAQGVVIGEHGMWGSNTDRPNGNYATFCAYNGGCRGNGNDFWAFSTHGVYPNAASSVVCGMYYGGSGTPWKDCPSGDNGHRMRYYIRSSDLQVTLLSVQAQSD